MTEQLKEVVEHKQGQPWKVEKICEDFESANLVRKNLLALKQDGLQVKVKFLSSVEKFVVKIRNLKETKEDNKGKKEKNSRKNTPTT